MLRGGPYSGLLLWLGQSLLIPGVGAASEAATNLTVNRHSRDDVAAFWQRYYMASEGYESRWAGKIDFENCILTPPPIEFTKDVQRRVNYYRAMAGLPGNASFEEFEVRRSDEDLFSPPAGTTKFQAAAAAALSLAAQDYDPDNVEAYRLQHDLDDTFECFSAAGWNGARNSNLAANLWGPGAIDGYMFEFGSPSDPFSNKEVGHRRWILFSAVGGMATADLPPVISGNEIVRPAINVNYVIGDFQAREHQFVAWPNDGYIPSALIPNFWSLSYPGADFSNAVVKMTGPYGELVPLKVLTRSQGIPRADQPPLIDPADPEDNNGDDSAQGPGSGFYADSTLVWLPEGLPSNFTKDMTYQVSVTGIEETPQTSFTYAVTIIDPNRVDGMELVGTDTPPVEGANYYFGGSLAFQQYEFEVSQRSAEIEVEDAEGEELLIVDGSLPQVDLVGVHDFPGTDPLTPEFYEGKKSFRLSFYDNDQTPQWFEVDRSLTTSVGAKVHFRYRRGFMTAATVLDVETSIDGGVTWQKTPLRISGRGDTVDPNFNTAAADLPVADGVRVRFFHFNTDPNQGVYGSSSGDEFAMGMFIDTISFSNTETASETVSVILPSGKQQGEFAPEALGVNLKAGESYRIRVRPISGDFSFAWGPVKEVVVQPSSPLVAFERWAELTYPTAGGFYDDVDGDGLEDGLEYALGTSPISGTDGLASLALTQEGGRFCFAAPGGTLQPGLSYLAEYSTDLENWTSEGVMVQTTGGQLKAFAPSDVQGKISMRWVISQQ